VVPASRGVKTCVPEKKKKKGCSPRVEKEKGKKKIFPKGLLPFVREGQRGGKVGWGRKSLEGGENFPNISQKKSRGRGTEDKGVEGQPSEEKKGGSSGKEFRVLKGQGLKGQVGREYTGGEKLRLLINLKGYFSKREKKVTVQGR